MSHTRYTNTENMYVDLSETSSAVTILSTHHKVLTVFFNQSSTLLQKAMDEMANGVSWCVANTRWGNREDPDHQLYHHNLDDVGAHTHFVKGKDYYEDFKPEEINCVLRYLFDIERGSKLCLNGKSNCIITHEKKDEINEKYEAYFKAEQKKNNASLPVVKPTTFNYILSGIAPLFQTAAYSFLATLLEKYIQPYLITHHGYKPVYAQLLMQFVRSAAMIPLVLTGSDVVFDAILRNGVKMLLSKLNIEPRTQEKLNNMLSCASTGYAFVSHIKSRMQNAGHLIGAPLGEYAAYQVIHRLPKIKCEPEPSNMYQEGSLEKISPLAPNGFRRR
jgi:hypothetical protein